MSTTTTTAGLAAATALAAFTGMAMGADAPPPPPSAGPDVVAPELSFDWNGTYAGVMVGGLRTGHHIVSNSGAVNARNTGVPLGAVTGFNAQFGSVVTGGELEFSIPPGPRPHRSGSFKVEESFTFAFKGRAGYVYKQSLVYGTAGVVVGMNRLSADGRAASGHATGYIVGAGVEQAVTEAITLRAEYDYLHFGRTDYNAGASFPRERTSGHRGTLGVNYKF